MTKSCYVIVMDTSRIYQATIISERNEPDKLGFTDCPSLNCLVMLLRMSL